MFKTWVGALPRSLRRAAQAQRPSIWEDTMRSMLTGQAMKFAGRPVRRNFSSTRALPSSARHSATRPSFANATRHAAAGGKQATRGFRFSPWRRSKGAGAGGEESLSLGQRFRKLSKEYGKAAVVVYFALSILDYPFFFLLVRLVGTERVAKVEHFIVSGIASVVPEPIRIKVRGYWEAFKNRGKKELTEDEQEKVEMVGWGVEEAQERYAEEASLATQLALAYAIHKSFIFVRLPLTAAVTPRVVKTLRAWGWNIGKPKPKV